MSVKFDPFLGRVREKDATGGTPGSGDVTGPASAVSGNLPQFSDATGKALSDSLVAVADLVLAVPAATEDNICAFSAQGKPKDSLVPLVDVMLAVPAATEDNLCTFSAQKKAKDSGVALVDVMLAVPAATEDNLCTFSAQKKAKDSGVALADVIIKNVAAVEDNIVTYDAAGKPKDSGVPISAVGAIPQEFGRMYQSGPSIVGTIGQMTARNAGSFSQFALNPATLPVGQQEITTAGTGDYAMGDDSLQTKVGMTFTANATYNATSVSIRLKKFGNPSDNVKVSLFSTSANLPNASLNACVSNLAGSAIATAYQDFTFRFPSTAATSATVYAMVIERTGAIDASNYYLVEVIATGGVAGSQACLYDGATWTAGGTVRVRYSINGGEVYDVRKRADDTAMTSTDSVFYNDFGFSISALAASKLRKWATGIETTAYSADDRIQVTCLAIGNTPASYSEILIKNA